ncbi:hypothetical protein [Cetobacterium sp.]|uniref:hypothetical protein n=1 Tax=Cetobacterium sp. TaxID=2071632 RepID=UPI003F2E07E5
MNIKNTVLAINEMIATLEIKELELEALKELRANTVEEIKQKRSGIHNLSEEIAIQKEIVILTKKELKSEAEKEMIKVQLDFNARKRILNSVAFEKIRKALNEAIDLTAETQTEFEEQIKDLAIELDVRMFDDVRKLVTVNEYLLTSAENLIQFGNELQNIKTRINWGK